MIKLQKHIDLLISRYPQLKCCEEDIISAYTILEESYSKGGKLMAAGNGGSAADAEHIVGELMKQFRIPRPISHALTSKLRMADKKRGVEIARSLECGLPAIAFVTHEALSTAIINDVDGQIVFAQQLLGYGKRGDVFLGISTSGNSANVMNAAVVARALDIPVIGLTGIDGGELGSFADVAVKVPETETYMVQELHLPIYHCWCLMLEDHFFGESGRN